MSCSHNPEEKSIKICQSCGQLINYYQWVVTTLIGKGSYATAYKVKRNGKEALLKLYHDSISSQDILIEKRNLFLAASIGVCSQPIEVYEKALVLEYIPLPTGLDVKDRVMALLQSVNRLHNYGLVHRDIKPDNIVGSTLIDYGSMVDLYRDVGVEPVGTIGYTPREAFQGVIHSKLDSFGVGCTISQWLGAPHRPESMPDALFMEWIPPEEWSVIRFLTVDNHLQRCSVGLAYHILSPLFAVEISTRLVTKEEYEGTCGPCHSHNGYVVNLSMEEVDAYCKKTNTRLPTVAEWKKAATGTERVKAMNNWDKAHDSLISDYGHRHMRRYLWQPTADGVMVGGTAYCDTESIPYMQNAMVGLRVCKK